MEVARLTEILEEEAERVAHQMAVCTKERLPEVRKEWATLVGLRDMLDPEPTEGGRG